MAVATIKDSIEVGKALSFTANTLHFKKVLTNSIDENFIILMNPIFDKYYQLMKDYIEEVELTLEEYNKYKYKPKLLSLDLYGTTELYILLMKLNNMTSVIEFDKEKIKVFTKNIIEVLNEIMVQENNNYIENELELINTING